MTPQAFVQRGSAESLKGSIHAAAAIIAGLMAAYNLAAFLVRKEPHLGWHAAGYGIAAGYEIKQTLRHLSR